MKGFLRWFKSGAKMKRWVVIILIGVTLCCYGMMKILTGKELEFMELARIITVFVMGFVLLIVGIISIQKRTLELLVAESDKRNSPKGSKNSCNRRRNRTKFCSKRSKTLYR